MCLRCQSVDIVNTLDVPPLPLRLAPPPLPFLPRPAAVVFAPLYSSRAGDRATQEQLRSHDDAERRDRRLTEASAGDFNCANW